MIVLLLSCSRNTQKMITRVSSEVGEIPENLVVDDTVRLLQIGDNMHLKYLGTGGYFIASEKDGLLIDPFFSPHQIVPMAFGKIGTIPENVEKGLDDLREVLYSRVSSVFVTHSHYDHLMDVPYVFHHFMDTALDNRIIYGSESTRTTLKYVVDSTHLSDISANVSSPTKVGEWVYLPNRTIRVMPVETKHAPHLKKGITIRLYKGEARPNPRYNHELKRMRPKRWRKGEVYGYLIDFLSGNDITARLYLLSSSSSPPNGSLPAEVLEEAPVDIAIVGSASFNNVENFPEGIVEHLNPDRILVTHWEDLFKPYQHSPSRMIRASDIGEYISRLNAIYPFEQQDVQRVYLPEPGTHFISTQVADLPMITPEAN